jgi:pimeloyl-ACP methyl ester carboxylesterase
MNACYTPRRHAQSTLVPVRGLRYHVLQWGEAAPATAAAPPLVLLHGWMDVAASFQFVVDALSEKRQVLAPDWRGFGLTDGPRTDSYWFPDYLGDLDALLDALVPEGKVDLAGHSMGGNVAMSYAGIRPARIRRLVNLEGFGMPRTQPEQAPRRLALWLDGLKQPLSMRPYPSVAAVAERLIANNPRLTPERALWLAPHWAERRGDGLWHLRGDPAHKRINPQLYRVDEHLETWKLITAPLLWLEGEQTDIARWWGTRYTKDEFHERLAVVPQVERRLLADCGHMLHHDRPAAVARHIEAFLDRP